MPVYLRRYSLFLFLLAAWPRLATAATPIDRSRISIQYIDEEYDAYRRKGDTFFKAGRYSEARQQYQNCLEVPGFENDEYAKGRIEVTTRCLALLQQADDALQNQNDTLVVQTLQQVLNLNPADELLISRIAEHYELEGNNLFANDRLIEARTYYVRAATYARQIRNRVKMSTLDTQIRAIDVRLDQLENEREAFLRTAPRRLPKAMPALPVKSRVDPTKPLLKIGLAVITAGSGLLAYSLGHDFEVKKEQVERLNAEFDLNNDGILDKPDQSGTYKDATEQLQKAAEQQGLYRICLGVATAALLGEAYLFLHKPQPRPTNLFWRPSATSYGLTIGYRF